jgi:hypothetical protein
MIYRVPLVRRDGQAMFLWPGAVVRYGDVWIQEIDGCAVRLSDDGLEIVAVREHSWDDFMFADEWLYALSYDKREIDDD